MSERFTQKAEKALNNSAKIAERLGHTYIGTEHILLALVDDELSCSAIILKQNGVTRKKLESIIKEYSGTGVKSALSSKDLTPRARSILENSYNSAIQYGNGVIGTEHILLSVIEEKDCVAIKLLKSLKADTGAVRDEILSLLKSREKNIIKQKKEQQTTYLKQYGKNLCALARDGQFDPVIGRDKETDRVIRILCRKSKNNPCLIGEAGVGKTAIIEGLAQRIVDNNVPDAIKGKSIISIDLTSMVAGAKYRGDFEDRIKNIVTEAIKNKDVILFIDEIHTIVGAGAAEGAIDASNILKPQLARGDIQLIGATTFAEYHKYIEHDSALERRFQPIMIDEPNEESTLEMLIALKPRYESHHNVDITDNALRECVELSSRYINDRFLPDKAIDVLDEACAMAANIRSNSLISAQNIKQYDDLLEMNSIGIEDAYDLEHKITRGKTTPLERACVTGEIIREVLSEICHIPTEMIKKTVDYNDLSRALNNKIIGQEDAICRLVSALKRSDMGLLDPKRPRGIFLFVGESGVGKTELAIELASNIFYGNNSLIRLDMSEFSEKQSISKLIGSPPGYVGYEEGGKLTEAVRKRPYSVILFDEIEKADKDILNILLQIADYGYLTDSIGRRINFRNSIIVMTTNIGTGSTATHKPGFVERVSKKEEKEVTESLKKHYRDEWLNRFDEIIYFPALSVDSLKKITRNKILQFSKKLEKKDCIITFDDNVLDYFIEDVRTKGRDARTLLRDIANRIELPIIEILSNTQITPKRIDVSVYENSIKFTTDDVIKA